MWFGIGSLTVATSCFAYGLPTDRPLVIAVGLTGLATGAASGLIVSDAISAQDRIVENFAEEHAGPVDI
jgi:hypothetical protein